MSEKARMKACFCTILPTATTARSGRAISASEHRSPQGCEKTVMEERRLVRCAPESLGQKPAISFEQPFRPLRLVLIQRLALARTLLTGTRLMLLDEPTAHLDALTESRILQVICRAVRGATTVIASHSPAVLAVCDRVMTLDRGQLLVGEAHLEPDAVAAG